MRRINKIILFVAVFSLFSSNIVFTAPVFAENDEKGDIEAPHVPNEIIIGFKAGTTPAGIENFYDKFFEEYQISELERLDSSTDDPGTDDPGDKLVSISHPATKGILQKLANDPRVEFAEYNYIMTIDAIPTDDLFGDLWGMHNTGQFGGTVDVDIDAPEAWDIATGSSDIIIGVIDTGIDYTHPDLVGNMWINPGEIPNNNIDDDNNGYVDDIHGWNAITDDWNLMDSHGHGTHVSGTIGAEKNDVDGVVGVNWNVSIAGCKFLGPQGGYTSDAVKCFNYFNNLKSKGHNVLITSNSWGGGGYSTSLYNAMNAFDGLHMTAAGNGKINNDILPHYPSNYNLANIISVASIDRHNVLSDHSTWGSNWGAVSVDIAAPGTSILSTLPGNSYESWSGTSMATPHVAGAAGLIWDVNPTLSSSQVKNLILSNGDPTVVNIAKPTLTNDRLNVYKSLLSTPTPSDFPPTVPNPIPDVNVDENAANTIIDLTSHFDDFEDGPDGLAYTVLTNDNPELVGTSFSGDSLILSYASDTTGEANITIRATDTYPQSVDDQFLVTISSVDDPPSGPITVTGISPYCVQNGDSVNVTISGTGFESGASVTLSNGAGPTPTISVNSVSSETEINASITTKNGGPNRDRYWDVTVTNPDLSSDTLVDGFLVTINPPCPIATITIDDVTQAEGDSDSTAFTFTITRSGDTSGISTVVVESQDGSATTLDNDYGDTICLITFLPLATESICPISINGDTTPEPDETFFVNLSDCVGCTISDSQGVGTITNDDASAPDAPVLSSTGKTQNTIDISWTTSFDGGSPITGYTFEWSTDNFATDPLGSIPVPDTTNSATISGLNDSTSYDIRVFATNANGSTSSNVLTVATSAPSTAPDAPVLSSTGNTDTTIDISWTTPSNGGSSIIDYTYEWSTDNFSSVSSDTTSSNSATIIGLTEDTEYKIRVFATNAVGDSPNSNTVTVSTSVAPTDVPIVVDIVYSTEGGKQGDKHLTHTMTFHDGNGSGISGISIYVTLKNLSTGTTYDRSATTDDSGILNFSLKNAPSGCYTTLLDNPLTPSGFLWNGYPDNTRKELRASCSGL